MPNVAIQKKVLIKVK